MTDEFKIDKHTIRSKKQFDLTELTQQYGSAWLIPEEIQESKIIKDFGSVVVRLNAFPKKHRRMYIIHPRRKARLEELTKDECFQIFQALAWLHKQEGNIGGGDIHRWGQRSHHASSIPTDHYFISVVVPDGTGPVAETLFKDQSPEKVAEREKRAKTFE